MQSATRLEAFLIKQGVLFLHVSNVLGMYGGMHMRSHASYAEAWNIDELNDTEFPIPKPQNNDNVSNNPNEIQPIIPSTASLPLAQDHNSDSEQSQSELQHSPTETDQNANQKNGYAVNPTINEQPKRNRRLPAYLQDYET